MELLITGVVFWSLVHLSPALAPPMSKKLVSRIGEHAYKALFTVLSLAALAVIVLGWRDAVASHLYLLPPFTRHIGMLLVLFAFILFGAPYYPTRIRRVLRHPQLTAVIIWALAHMMMNIDSRSLVLFGGLCLWAILEIILINRRDGEWVKPEAGSWAREIRGLVVSVVIFLAVIWLHPHMTGMAIM